MKTWQEFLPDAAARVAAVKQAYPGAEGVVAFDFGGSSSSGAFSRRGDGRHERFYDVPQGISSLVTSNAASANLDPALSSAQNKKYLGLMKDTPQKQPGFSQLLNTSNQDPRDYAGKTPLTSISQRNPFDGGYEDATQASYQQRAADAMAQVGTGPDAVRGGDARTGIAQGVMANQLAIGRGEELRKAQLQDSALVTDASKSMAGIEQARSETGTQAALGLNTMTSGVGDRALGAAQGVDRTKEYNMQLLQLAAGLNGRTIDTQKDNFAGEGDQSGTQAGISCCFIFNEALNGDLPMGMELARAEYYTPLRRAGYCWMAEWLVPAMRASVAVRHLTNVILIRPFLRFSEYLYGEPNCGLSALYAPYCFAWLNVWGGIGRLVKGK